MYDERAAAERLASELGVERVRSPDWQRSARRPNVQLPDGACDTHIHLIGPQIDFPLQPGPFNFLDFEDSTIDDWLRLKETLGMSRGVHVQSFMYGHGYHYVLHTLHRAAGSLKAVVNLWPGITDEELNTLESAGVIGARFSATTHPEIDEALIRRIVERGWSIHYSLGPTADENWRWKILDRPGSIVLEHLGLAPGANGTSSPEFAFVLQALESGRCWVKLSARGSDALDLPFPDLAPMVDAVLEAMPSRILWGSDWPHIPYFRPMPHDADLVDLAWDWIAEEDLMRQVFVLNPAEAFDWPV
jgi:predicted TIM-barrel fold metal-dependent hydrolase